MSVMINFLKKIMGRHRKRHQNNSNQSSTAFYTKQLELTPSKFVLKEESVGVYSIWNIAPECKIMIRRFADKNAEYALNCAQETLDYITREI